MTFLQQSQGFILREISLDSIVDYPYRNGQMSVTADVNKPYKVYRNGSGKEWRLLKRYGNQTKWYAGIKAKNTNRNYDLIDVLIEDIVANDGVQVQNHVVHRW